MASWNGSDAVLNIAFVRSLSLSRSLIRGLATAMPITTRRVCIDREELGVKHRGHPFASVSYQRASKQPVIQHL